MPDDEVILFFFLVGGINVFPSMKEKWWCSVRKTLLLSNREIRHREHRPTVSLTPGEEVGVGTESYQSSPPRALSMLQADEETQLSRWKRNSFLLVGRS